MLLEITTIQDIVDRIKKSYEGKTDQSTPLHRMLEVINRMDNQPRAVNENILWSEFNWATGASATTMAFSIDTD